jgi:hypothetical protein
LPDALFCLFITGLMALLLQGASASLKKAATGAVSGAEAIIEERNQLAYEIFD